MGVIKRAARALSRRAFAQTLAGAALAHVCRAAEPDRPDQLAWTAEGTPKLNFERRYRADAQVLVFVLPLLHREGVGASNVVWREFDTGSVTRLLEFTGFSEPERAAGLNRMGFIREMSRAAGDHGMESVYFGLMTASPEGNAEEARKALHSGAKEQDYSVIQGRIAVGETETVIAHFTAPAAVAATHRTELVDRARRALASAGKASKADCTRSTTESFLQTLARLLMRPDGAEGHYIYSGKLYRIRLARSVDGKATTYFRERQLVAASTNVIRVSGRVRRETDNKETDFRLWIPSEGERPLPLRIEYQAKSYLRLTFEAAHS